MAKQLCSEEDEPKELSQAQSPPEEHDSSSQNEFDFIERPSEDFFCPVTFELLLSPHQTTCCGNHLSEKAVRRLQRDGKPCPMCKEPQLTTVQDKFHRRRVSAVQVRCPHTPSGCEWVGEAGVMNQHGTTCPKRPWKCQHCEFASTYDVEMKHMEQCVKYPIPCPNECEIGMVPRCDVEKHRRECSLEPMLCEFVDVGCSVKVARRDFKRHMEESLQQHLLSATLLNLKLAKVAIVEKDHQLIEKDKQLSQKDGILLEKDNSIAAKDKVVAEKDVVIAQKDEAFAKMIAEKDKIIAEKESQLLELQIEFKKFQQEFMESAKDYFLEKSTYRFVIENFSCIQKQGHYGDWLSDPFSVSGYNLRLNVETKQKGSNMKVRLYPNVGLVNHSMILVVMLQLLNQLDNDSHYSKKITIELQKGSKLSGAYNFIAFQELYRRDKTVQYFKDDSLRICMWIKMI